jgi:hypothetical protein
MTFQPAAALIDQAATKEILLSKLASHSKVEFRPMVCVMVSAYCIHLN